MTDEQALATITPAMEITGFNEDVSSMMKLVKDQMTVDHDYGVIPGTKKKSLYDPGAEKLAKFFGLVPNYEKVKEVEDFEKGFFYYTYRCTLTHFKTGKFAGSAERSCNSFEDRYLFKSVWNNGMKSKVRVEPEHLIEKINTIQAMAQKRAFVEAVKTATMASELFIDTQVRDVAPGAPVTRMDNPGRVQLLAKLFSVAKERGFSDEKVRESMHRKYKVDTIGKVSDAEIEETIESLILKYDVVGKDGKPTLLNATPTPPAASVPEVEEGEVVVDEIDKELGVTEKDIEERKKKAKDLLDADTEPLDRPVSKNCYGCGKVIDGEAYNTYYHSKECNDLYLNKIDPEGKNKRKLQELVNKGREGATT